MAAKAPGLVTPLRLEARWVLPIAAPPLADAAVLIGADGRIEAVGPAGRVRAPRGGRSLDLGEVALLPGLVNVHTHLELTALRGLIAPRAFPEWIAALRAVKDGLDGAHFRAGARWGVLEAFAAGITTVADTGSTGAAAAALADLGARGIVYQEVFGPEPARCEEAMAGLAAAVSGLERHARRAGPRLVVGVSPHAPYTVSTALLGRVARWAREEGRPLAVHAAESAAEAELVRCGAGPFAEALRRRGIAVEPLARSTVAWLEEAGALGPTTLLIHLVTADQADVDLIAARGASAAHCPGSNAALGQGRAPLGVLLRAGVPVGVGSDSVVAGGRLDLFAEARLAALNLRADSRDPAAIEGDAPLKLATLEGARALGLADQVGSLEPGKWGDVVAVGLDAAGLVPGGDPGPLVAWSATAGDVVLTVVAGEIVYARGVWPKVDAPAEREAAQRAHVAAREVLASRVS